MMQTGKAAGFRGDRRVSAGTLSRPLVGHPDVAAETLIHPLVGHSGVPAETPIHPLVGHFDVSAETSATNMGLPKLYSALP
jgi:hypothetical protein